MTFIATTGQACSIDQHSSISLCGKNTMIRVERKICAIIGYHIHARAETIRSPIAIAATKICEPSKSSQMLRNSIFTPFPNLTHSFIGQASRCFIVKVVATEEQRYGHWHNPILRMFKLSTRYNPATTSIMKRTAWGCAEWLCSRAGLEERGLSLDCVPFGSAETQG